MPSCSQKWQEFEGKCYLWVADRPRKWADAENFCKSRGGHLASVTSLRIYDYILGKVGEENVWIGARDKERTGAWEWSDGSLFDYKGSIHSSTRHKKKGCAEFSNKDESEKGLSDQNCDTPLDFVCAAPMCSPPGT